MGNGEDEEEADTLREGGGGTTDRETRRWNWGTKAISLLSSFSTAVVDDDADDCDADVGADINAKDVGDTLVPGSPRL